MSFKIIILLKLICWALFLLLIILNNAHTTYLQRELTIIFFSSSIFYYDLEEAINSNISIYVYRHIY